MITLYTMGFTKKTAQDFFSKLNANHVERVIDVRLNNTSQLAGFTKQNDLEYFLGEILDIEYINMPQLAPTKEILKDYRDKNLEWADYESRFEELIISRGIIESIGKGLIDKSCLLCSEDKPDHCHRRLVAEYLAEEWGDIEIVHL